VEADGFAGEDEGADAILVVLANMSGSVRDMRESKGLACALATALMADRGIVAGNGGDCDDAGAVVAVQKLWCCAVT
jgi:hypothetical protein